MLLKNLTFHKLLFIIFHLFLLSFFLSFTSSIAENEQESPETQSFQKMLQLTNDTNDHYHIKWSPDGQTLAFVSRQTGEPKIWLIPAKGGKPVILETGLSGDHHISWKPDSKFIVFDALYHHIAALCQMK